MAAAGGKRLKRTRLSRSRPRSAKMPAELLSSGYARGVSVQSSDVRRSGRQSANVLQCALAQRAPVSSPPPPAHAQVQPARPIRRAATMYRPLPLTVDQVRGALRNSGQSSELQRSAELKARTFPVEFTPVTLGAA